MKEILIKGKPLKTLLSEEEIQKRVKELGEQLSKDYRGLDPIIIGVLRGAYMFLTDLTRYMDIPLTIDFLGVSSYGNRTASGGVVRFTSDLYYPIVDRHVILVEDIVDTGLTMNYLIENLMTRHPKSLKVCALLEKPDRLLKPVKIDYLGFTIPNRFVIGYGLDFMGRYRNLPYIGFVEGIDDDE